MYSTVPMIVVRDAIVKRQDLAALAAAPTTSLRAPRQPHDHQLRNPTTRAKVRKHAANFPQNGGPQPRHDPCGSRHYQMGQHDHQPPQVLPLDEANSLALIRLRYAGAGYAGYGWIHDRGQVGNARQAEGRPHLRVLDMESGGRRSGANEAVYIWKYHCITNVT